jgi:DNA (cytosine-5)-methyltransferase 1
MRPVALDLFCKAGGATKGLQRAGFYVVGVDIEPQPNYCGDLFVQADALKPPFDLRLFDFIWASPPCQAYTGMQRINTRSPKRDHPKLVEPVREMLRATGTPYVIENVPGAPLVDPITLCGSMFDLGVWRHRLFESNYFMLQPKCQHERCPKPIAVYGDHPQKPGDKTMRVYRARTLKQGHLVMGIDWMTWRELTQAIPPAYSEFIGRAALNHIHSRASAPRRAIAGALPAGASASPRADAPPSPERGLPTQTPPTAGV